MIFVVAPAVNGTAADWKMKTQKIASFVPSILPIDTVVVGRQSSCLARRLAVVDGEVCLKLRWKIRVRHGPAVDTVGRQSSSSAR